MDTYIKSVVARLGLAGSSICATLLILLGIGVIWQPVLLPWLLGCILIAAGIAVAATLSKTRSA